MLKLCPYCHVGKLEGKEVPYVQWQEDKSILIEYIPALVCDACGEKTYDPQALDNLQRLLWAKVEQRSV